MNPLDVSVAYLPGIGEAYVKRLNKLGIHTLFDLLLLMPRSYETHGLHSAAAQEDSDKSIVIGDVLEQHIREGRRRMLTALLNCRGEHVLLRFFHFYPNQVQMLRTGNIISATGVIRKNLGYCEMIHPRIALAKPEPVMEPPTSAVSSSGPHHIEPIYPLTEGMNNQKLKQFIETALKFIEKQPLPELIPPDVLKKFNWEDINAALHFIHAPHPNASLDLLKEMRHPLQQRLSFEELLAHRLALRSQSKKQVLAPVFSKDSPLIEAFLKSLPYQATEAQWRCFTEIKADLNRTKPMLRLLQGDVGAGKTLVAQLSSLIPIAQGFQVAMMAPTEILAEQHYLKTKALFEPLGISTLFLAGKCTAKIKKQAYAMISEGQAQMVIGTHALIQEAVTFHQLGLVIIDEQHRFGVSQRLSLQEKGKDKHHSPHQLVMTATPIPRTLAMSIYADLDISVIDHLPQGRKPIHTSLLSQQKRPELIQRLAVACRSGKQAYWVCPLIEESEVLELEAAEVLHQRLLKELPHIRIGLIHGRMNALEKSQVMQSFKAHQLDLLIATTVIEVGVDVPNASIMVIENPERMGLSQLHQLRGRVGRGSTESFCILLYQAPMSPSSYQRLTHIRDHHDGFYLAEQDLKIRGPGEFLGTRQTGGLNFRLASLMRDAPLLQSINELAKRLDREHPEIAQALVSRWFSGKLDFIKA